MKTVIAIVFALAVSACASIPIPKAAQVQAATAVGCAVIDASGCYNELTAAFPTLSKATCSEVVSTTMKAAENAKEMFERNRAIYGTELNKMLSTLPDGQIDLGHWDPLNVDVSKIRNLERGRCSKVARALGVK